MNSIKRARVPFLLLSSSLIITFTLFVTINFARAEGPGGIDPHQAIDIVTLYAAQSATFSTSQATPIGSYSVGVISINNKALTATFTVNTSGALGFWTILMIGTGPRNWIDFAFGFAFPTGGLTAAIDVHKDVSLGIAIGTAFVFSPVSAEEPFRYSIKVAGTAS
jgi:hypothetical protein